ncbi:MAG: carboxypeptidase-like regulatory domain-containing protein [Xanthomonadales bacterium]|nr:carboxypeptidase-like regulatory domain-containing protein [Xanthomonadales bacterium]
MTSWQVLPEERRMLYSPVGLRMLDDFTGRAPSGSLEILLDVQDSNGQWHEVDVHPVRTPSEVITYPGLGRSAHAATQPLMRYRVRIDGEYYRPDYLINLDGVEFDNLAYDDQNPPPVVPIVPQDLFLLPATNYPFPRHIRVLRGHVEDNAGDPVANVEVTEGPRERVLTDERGTFSLPLRWPGLNAAVVIDAVDHRTGHAGQLNINLPGDLSGAHTIIIT